MGLRQPKDIIINGKTLEEILINHKHWIEEDCDYWGDMRANLCGADLSDADLKGVDLRSANLVEADLSCSDLEGANLRLSKLTGAQLDYTNLIKVNLSSADLYRANLRRAHLGESNLSCAVLFGADLSHADLSLANLEQANLEDANLEDAELAGANLCHVELYNTKGSLMEYRKGKMLTEDIIGYKKCMDDVIVTLLIPRGAIVFSISGNKCRTNKAKVIAIDGADRAYSHFQYMTYYVGDEFTMYDFSCEYNRECAEGIHFFMTREEAENYIY